MPKTKKTARFFEIFVYTYIQMPEHPIDHFLIQNQMNRNHQVHWKSEINRHHQWIPAAERTYAKALVKMSFLFPKVGYVK